MATVYISEYDEIDRQDGMAVQVAKEPSLTTQSFPYTSSNASLAFSSKTSFIRIIVDADARLVFGDNPTATKASLFLPSGVSEYFGVVAGQKVAVYDGTT